MNILSIELKLLLKERINTFKNITTYLSIYYNKNQPIPLRIIKTIRSKKKNYSYNPIDLWNTPPLFII